MRWARDEVPASAHRRAPGVPVGWRWTWVEVPDRSPAGRRCDKMVAMDTIGIVAAANAGQSIAARPDTNLEGEAARTLSARGRALAHAAEALRSTAGGRGHAVAIASALEDMESALEAMATTTDELRRESLWLMREAEALWPGQAHSVAAAAEDFRAWPAACIEAGRRAAACTAVSVRGWQR